jgi:trigger factor
VTHFLIGKKVGETAEVDAELAEGKRLGTALDVVGLREVVLPDIDDELAKDAGFDSLELLKKDIREKLAEGQAERRERRIEALLVDSLVEKSDIPLPDVFVSELVDEEIGQIKESLERPGSSLSFAEYIERRETTEEALREEIRTSVSLRVRRELILRALAKAEGVSIDDDELAELAKVDAEEAGEDPLRFTARLKAEERWDDYRASNINKRLFQILREQAVISDKEE